MSWPQAFAIVGFCASIAAIVWAVSWMTVRTETHDFKLSEPPSWTAETRKKSSPAPRPPRES